MTTRRAASLVLLLAAPLLVAVGGWRADDVPDPLPTHWDLHGHVDGTTGFAAFTALVLLATALVALVGAGLVAAGGRARAVTAVMFGWLGWLFAMLYVGTLAAAAEADRAETVSLPWWLLVVGLAVPSLVGLVLLVLLPPERPRLAQPAPVLDLAPGERAVWFGSARSVALAWAGGMLALVGAVLVPFEPVPGLVLVLAGVVGWWVHVVTVRVDASGLRATWGPTRWPGRTVRLDDVAAVEAIELEPVQWGGWGYRISPRGAALVVRRGPAIVVRRRGGGALAVTVDGAHEAAALLATLAQRAGAPAR